MQVEVERVAEVPWTHFPVVQVRTRVGRTAVPWCGARDVVPGRYRVEWTIDLPFAWGDRARPAEAPGPAILTGGHCVVLRGLLDLTTDGGGVLDLDGSKILVDFTEPSPPAAIAGTWVDLYVPHEHVGLYPYDL